MGCNGGSGGGGGSEYTLNIQCDGYGRVMDTSGYAIVNRKIPAGTTVTLVPVGETGGWVFNHWDGQNGTEVVNHTITMNGDKNITAVFSHITYNVNIRVEGQGTVIQELVVGALSLTTYKGDKIRLNPYPVAGWYFDHWEGDISSDEILPELVVDSNKNITAVFKQAIPYTTFVENAEGGQTSYINPDGIWTISTESSFNSTHSWAINLNNFTGNNTDMYLTTCAIKMNGSQYPYLEFWHNFNTDLNYFQYYNSGFVEISNDNKKTWHVIKTFTNRINWQRQIIPLSIYKDDTIFVRFKVNSNYMNKWYIDEIYIKDTQQISYTAFHDDVENQSQLMIPEGTWGRTTESSHSSTHSWTDSPNANYRTNTYISLTSCIIDMNGSQHPILQFWHHFNYNDINNICSVEISKDDGNSWNVSKKYINIEEEINWSSDIIFLEEYKTDKIRIRFNIRISTLSNGVHDGWYIDDIQIKELTEVSYSLFNDDAENQTSLMNHTGIWGKTTESSHSPLNSWTDSPNIEAIQGLETNLISCFINMNGSQNPVLEYWYKYIEYSSLCYVQVSIDSGKTWTGGKYLSASTDWKCDSISLESYKTNIILIRFSYKVSSYSNVPQNVSLYIDDLTIK